MPSTTKTVCPKCNSNNVIIGNNNNPNVCDKCNHKWKKDEDDVILGCLESESFQRIIFRSPEVLATINQKPKINHFNERMDLALSNIDEVEEEIDPSTKNDIYNTFFNMGKDDALDNISNTMIDRIAVDRYKDPRLVKIAMDAYTQGWKSARSI